MNQSVIRSRIINAAIRSFAEKGYHRTTIYDVARSARCTEETITHLFRSKADLLMASLAAADTIRHAHKPTLNSLRNGPAFTADVADVMTYLYCKVFDRVNARMRLFCYLERPDLMRHFFESSTLPYVHAICDRLRIERARGAVRKDVHVETAAVALLFMCEFRRLFEGAVENVPGLNLKRRDMRYFTDVWLCGVLKKSEISTALQG